MSMLEKSFSPTHRIVRLQHRLAPDTIFTIKQAYWVHIWGGEETGKLKYKICTNKKITKETIAATHVAFGSTRSTTVWPCYNGRKPCYTGRLARRSPADGRLVIAETLLYRSVIARSDCIWSIYPSTSAEYTSAWSPHCRPSLYNVGISLSTPIFEFQLKINKYRRGIAGMRLWALWVLMHLSTLDSSRSLAETKICPHLAKLCEGKSPNLDMFTGWPTVSVRCLSEKKELLPHTERFGPLHVTITHEYRLLRRCIHRAWKPWLNAVRSNFLKNWHMI